MGIDKQLFYIKNRDIIIRKAVKYYKKKYKRMYNILGIYQEVATKAGVSIGTVRRIMGFKKGGVI